MTVQIMFLSIVAYNIAVIPVAILWRKKHYKKQVNCDPLIGPVFLSLSFATLILLGWGCLFPETTKTDIGILEMMLVLLTILTIVLPILFLYFSTLCIYFEDDFLRKKSFFGTRKLVINQYTTILREYAGYTVLTDTGAIKVDSRHQKGDFWSVYSAILDRIDRCKAEMAYDKVLDYGGSTPLGKHLIVFKGKTHYFLVAIQGREMSYYLIDLNRDRLYSANEYVQKTGYAFAPNKPEYAPAKELDADLTHLESIKCPDWLKDLFNEATPLKATHPY